jgi:hypothetical protein
MVSLLAFVCVVSGMRSASAADAESVFKSVSPSVVMIKDLEGFGSGVVLTSDGLIVTCYHVVNTPLKQTVIAEVRRMGETSRQEFTNVKLVGVHPTYDLALIQVQAPPGVTFVVPPKSAGRPISTGEDCFVIGNPSGAAGKALENSITRGIVSAADRAVDDQRFIQISAPVNPGNSGGALCDKNGVLVGIVTFKIDQAEGLGFAIPITNTRRTDFVPARDRKGDKAKGIKYEEAGTRWYEVAMRSEGDRREAAMGLAYVCFRLSVMELPNEASPYNNVGLMYFSMDEFETARAFYEKAVELTPDMPSAHHMLGMIAIKQDDKERAKRHFLAGMASRCTDATGVASQASCADNYAVSMLEEQLYPGAAYGAKWALALHDDPRRRATRQKVLQDSSQHLSDAQFAEITAKQDGFSVEDMRRFASGRPGPGASAASTASRAAGTPPPAAGPSASAVAKLFEKVLEGAPKPDAAGLKKALPEAPADVRPALGGAYLVMHFKGIGKLGVFNVAQARFETYIPVPEEALYAAGGVTLLLYLPKERVFQTWDMRTFQLTGSRPSRIIGELTDIDMGLLNSQSALVSYADGTSQLSARHYGILDLDTFQTLNLTDRIVCRNACYRDNVHMRPDENFTAVVMWATSHSPSGFIFARLTKRGPMDAAYEHEDWGSLGVDRQGQRVYSTQGRVLGPKGQPLKAYTGAALFAVKGGDFFLEVRKNQVTVRESLGETEVGRFQLPFSFAVTSWSKDNLTDDRLVHASAALNRACFVDLKTSSAYVFALGLGADGTQLKEAMDGVPKGTLWTRNMGFPSGTRVNVEDAPAGTKYDPATSTLSWPVPKSQPSGKVTILLSVTLPGKDEGYQRVMVPVQ